MTPEAFYANDRPEEIDWLKRCLDRHKHTIPVFATSVREVKDRIPEIKDKGIKAAIIDCRMPLPEDGLETAKMLKAEVPGIRIIVLTGSPRLVTDDWGADSVFDKGHLSLKMLKEISEEIDKAYQQS
jgi:DNA-binding NtrC family response regulator